MLRKVGFWVVAAAASVVMTSVIAVNVFAATVTIGANELYGNTVASFDSTRDVVSSVRCDLVGGGSGGMIVTVNLAGSGPRTAAST